MKTKLYIFNESCFGGLYGIGTYINQIISFFSRNEEVETHIFNIRYNCKEVIISQGSYPNNHIYYIPEKSHFLNYLYNKEIYYRNIFFILRGFIENNKNNRFLFFYTNHKYLIESVKQYFGKGKIYFVIHFFPWSLEIKGNTSYFKQIICTNRKKLKNDKERNVYDFYKKEISILKKIDSIICLSEFAYNTLINIYKVENKKIWVIYNGIKDEFHRMSLAEKNTIKSNLLFKSNEKILLYVGRLDENKGGKELINAFKLLLIEEPDCRLVIIGNGDESIYFEQMQMYWSKIIFSGRLPKELIYKFYQIADVGILPSFAEQCSYVAIEMMMHGLPIVGTDSTGLSEMIIDGENGYKVNLNENENDVFLDTVRLSQLIKKIISNPTLKEYLSQQSRLIFKNKYNIDEMKRKYSNLFIAQ